MNRSDCGGSSSACPDARSAVLGGTLEAVLGREWLLTNGTGGYASGTVVGCPTRRYHGMLIVARRPPLERVVTLSAVSERFVIGGRPFELSNFEFNGSVHPYGFRHLVAFDTAVDPPRPWARWEYAVGNARIAKHVTMQHGEPLVRLRYEVDAPQGTNIEVELLPLIALRDFHACRRKGAHESFEVHGNGSAVRVIDSRHSQMSIALFPSGDSTEVSYHSHPDWWYNFRYRCEAERGLEWGEDLFTPGAFRAAATGSFVVELTTVAGVESIAEGQSKLVGHSTVVRQPPAGDAPKDDAPLQALQSAAGQFVVRRQRQGEPDNTTVLAGYPWFGDWGRDAMIALPGLLLNTIRHVEAREVLTTFALAEERGLIPNRFSDYGDGCDYNSVDASLWFIHAADAYVRTTGDVTLWQTLLGPVSEKIVERFLEGTRYNIRVGSDRLVRCGDASTPVTWMDARSHATAVTPRHGMPVEVNALWYHDLRLLADRIASQHPARAEHYHSLADAARSSFVDVFWNADDNALFDCVRDGERDASIRPNQILAVSLEHSPLDAYRQRSVVDCVTRHLLTPFGLRTLAPSHSAYRGRYEGDAAARDAAYHQGTVWPWLMGAFVEACLRVDEFTDAARDQARERLKPLLEHINRDAGLGSISEIFDGDPPHTPRGCIAQAWSVAEILRAWHLIESGVPSSVACR